MNNILLLPVRCPLTGAGAAVITAGLAERNIAVLVTVGADQVVDVWSLHEGLSVVDEVRAVGAVKHDTDARVNWHDFGSVAS